MSYKWTNLQEDNWYSQLQKEASLPGALLGKLLGGVERVAPKLEGAISKPMSKGWSYLNRGANKLEGAGVNAMDHMAGNARPAIDRVLPQLNPGSAIAHSGLPNVADTVIGHVPVNSQFLTHSSGMSPGDYKPNFSMPGQAVEQEVAQAASHMPEMGMGTSPEGAYGDWSNPYKAPGMGDWAAKKWNNTTAPFKGVGNFIDAYLPQKYKGMGQTVGKRILPAGLAMGGMRTWDSGRMNAQHDEYQQQLAQQAQQYQQALAHTYGPWGRLGNLFG